MNNRDDDMEEKSIVGIYLKEISKHPILSAEEERTVFKQIGIFEEQLNSLLVKFEKGEVTGEQYKISVQELNYNIELEKKIMICSNLRLVVAIAKKYNNQGIPFADLINNGNLGLIQATERFDYTKGFRFSTYAMWWIRQEILSSLAAHGRTIRLPQHMFEKVRRYRRALAILSELNGRQPTVAELSEYLSVPVKNVFDLMISFQDVASLDAVFDDSNGDDLLSYLVDERSDFSFEELHISVLRENIEIAMQVLNEKEKKIVKMRYGLDTNDPHTLDRAGQQMGITRERVRQIQQKAIEKLKLSREILDFEYSQ